jgi:uncharacterized protein YjbJ (UPF0337 family)
MNKDQFKGGVKELSGKLQKELGKLVGSPTQQDKGVDLQIEGRAQAHLGDLKEFEELEMHDRKFNKRSDDWVNGRG